MTEAEHDPAPLDPHATPWPVPEPPPGFAEAAVERFLADDDAAGEPVDGVATPRVDRRRWAALGTAVALAAALLLWVGLRGRAVSDSVVARSRTTLTMHDRATAVAEAGTALRWSVDADGTARVEQDRGSVFYRVESGPAFEVQTPAGMVSVTGTCFEVEIMDKAMSNNNRVKAAALGAALASAVVVTVYEGGVVLANDDGQVALAAGERGRAEPGAAPRHHDGADDGASLAGASNEPATGDSGDADPDGAVAHARRQARALERAREDGLAKEAEIERLRRQVTELGGNPGTPSPKELQARAQRCAAQGRGGECPFLEPDEQTLREMARCAAVKIDFPGFLDNVETPEVGGLARTLGMSDPAEVAGLQAAADKHYAEFNSGLRDIFVQLGGDPEMAEQASAATMKSYIADQLDRELMSDIQRRVAEERAGLRPPPEDLSALSIEERAFRMHAELGNRFEEHLAAQVGADRARELRRVKDGWPGSTSVNTGDCIDP